TLLRRLLAGHARSEGRSEEIHLRARLGSPEALRCREGPAGAMGPIGPGTGSDPLVRSASAQLERRPKSETLDYSASNGPPPALATSSCLTRSTLNFAALAMILSSASSKSKDVAFENLVKFTRETTNGFRYGLVKPRAFSLSTAAVTASSSFRIFLPRRSRSLSACAIGLSRNSSTRRRIGWYAPPLRRGRSS